MSKTHYVYFVEAGKFKKSAVKIGVTTDIDSRILSLQTGNPYELKCKALIQCESRKEAYKLESYLHSRLRRFRLVGEWFKSEYFDLKSVLNDYVSKGVKVKSNDDYTKSRLPILTIRSLQRDIKALNKEIKDLKAENDGLVDQLNNAEGRDYWVFD